MLSQRAQIIFSAAFINKKMSFQHASKILTLFTINKLYAKSG